MFKPDAASHLKATKGFVTFPNQAVRLELTLTAALFTDEPENIWKGSESVYYKARRRGENGTFTFTAAFSNLY